MFKVLAIKIFSACPNSMSEERTMSDFTDDNTAKRNRQSVATAVARATIKQHVRFNAAVINFNWYSCQMSLKTVSICRIMSL